MVGKGEGKLVCAMGCGRLGENLQQRYGVVVCVGVGVGDVEWL